MVNNILIEVLSAIAGKKGFNTTKTEGGYYNASIWEEKWHFKG